MVGCEIVGRFVFLLDDNSFLIEGSDVVSCRWNAVGSLVDKPFEISSFVDERADELSGRSDCVG